MVAANGKPAWAVVSPEKKMVDFQFMNFTIKWGEGKGEILSPNRNKHKGA